MKEIRVYLVKEDDPLLKSLATDELFIKNAERQGTVFSLEGFQHAFNDGQINSNTDLILIK